MASPLEKRIALLIVEGTSDATALRGCIHKYLRLHYPKTDIDCEVYGTDISINESGNGQRSGDPQLVLDRVKTAFDEYLNTRGKSQKIAFDDIASVATLSDLDACFCREEAVIQGEEGAQTVIDYDCQRQKVFCKDVKALAMRNKNKCEALMVLADADRLLIAQA